MVLLAAPLASTREGCYTVSMTYTTHDIDTATEEMLDGTLVCLVWSGLDYTEDDDGNPCPLDENYSTEDVTMEARATIYGECADFIQANLADCLAYVAACESGGRIGYNGVDGSPWAWMGHDFALTRNHHGAGFWDRGLGELGDRLTAACRPYGECNLYVADDGSLEVE